MLSSTQMCRVLVLDDDEVIRDLLQALLAGEGFQTTIAATPDEALLAAQSGTPFDVLLTDIRLPQVDDNFLFQELRPALPPHVLFLGMSGSEPSVETKSAFDAFLMKPFDVQLLRDAIDAAHTRKRATGSAAEAAKDVVAPLLAVPATPLNEGVFQSLTEMVPAAQLSALYAMALKDIGKRHEKIISAVQAGDVKAVQREAHAMKGSCGMIGAAELQALAALLEEGTTPDKSAVEQIPLACQRLQRMLDTKLQSV